MQPDPAAHAGDAGGREQPGERYDARESGQRAPLGDGSPGLPRGEARERFEREGGGPERRGGARAVRIAAVGDVHVEENRRGQLFDVLGGIASRADYLCLCGDLTYSGKIEQAHALVEELKGVDIPIIAVLGNHDHEGGVEHEMAQLLKDAGVHFLDGDGIVLDGIGFVGTKGFVGGFGKRSLAPFGEKALKLFVQLAIDEALRLENALRNLHTETKVAVLHYSPIPDTVRGEPEEIFPFLGSSRYLPPLEMHGTSVIFHGHAHHGTMEGRTPAGIPVYNVALPLLREAGLSLRIWTCNAPERRGSQPKPRSDAA